MVDPAPFTANDAQAVTWPLVSVFMPVYNQELYVAAALDSVLKQTYENYEIVISDDCSYDSTPIIVKRYVDKFPEKIHFQKLSSKNLGSRHFELLLKQCKGDYVCMFSGDDIMYPDKIRRQMDDVLRLGLDFHSHSVDCINELGVIFSEKKVAKNQLFRGNGSFIAKGVPTVGCSWLVKRSYARFDQSVGFLHDFDMVIRVLRGNGFGYVCAEKLGAYRVTKTSWSRNLNCQNYLSAYLNLTKGWIKSKMYLECLWLIIRLLVYFTRLGLKYRI